MEVIIECGKPAFQTGEMVWERHKFMKMQDMLKLDGPVDSKALYCHCTKIVQIHEILFLEHHGTYGKGINFWDLPEVRWSHVWSWAKDQVTTQVSPCTGNCNHHFLALCVHQLVCVLQRDSGQFSFCNMCTYLLLIHTFCRIPPFQIYYDKVWYHSSLITNDTEQGRREIGFIT